jgi:hypothetical protein
MATKTFSLLEQLDEEKFFKVYAKHPQHSDFPKTPKLYDYVKTVCQKSSYEIEPHARLFLLCLGMPKKLTNNMYQAVSYICRPVMALYVSEKMMRRLDYKPLTTLAGTELILNLKPNKISGDPVGPFWIDVALELKKFNDYEYFPFQINTDPTSTQKDYAAKVVQEYKLEVDAPPLKSEDLDKMFK